MSNNVSPRIFFLHWWVLVTFKLFLEYVKIPNISPDFDKDWEKDGLVDKVIALLAKWIEDQKLAGCSVKVLKETGKTHIILAVIEATEKKPDEKTLFFYGHCDKQPPCTEQWRKPLHPYTPVIEGTRLYGRGASDDGYSTFAIIASIKMCQIMGVPHDRCVVVIESCEESGSKDLGYYLNEIKDVIKTPSLMVIMDSGCGDYERLWITSSLRGNLSTHQTLTCFRMRFQSKGS